MSLRHLSRFIHNFGEGRVFSRERERGIKHKRKVIPLLPVEFSPKLCMNPFLGESLSRHMSPDRERYIYFLVFTGE